MNSASILMNLAPAAQAVPAAATPVSTGAACPGQVLSGTGSFDAALAVAQATSGLEDAASLAQTVPMEMVPDLLLQATVTVGKGHADTAPEAGREVDADPDANADAALAGAAAVLAQMLAGPAAQAEPEITQAPDPSVPPAMMQAAKPMLPGPAAQAGSGSAAAGPGEEGAMRDGERGSKGSDGSFAAAGPPLETLLSAAVTSPDTSPESPAAGSQAMQGSSQTAQSAQAAMLSAATALRDASPAAASGAPGHAVLREPVGTARWADELGNRLVLMSMRGQQHGSLVLTPEHLGPVEVQISVSRDTANVWFGAQHADTRTALAEAMPRLKELLAASGLSLGQSGVSEQAPRESLAPRAERNGPVRAGIDADGEVEKPAPAWRVWRPGLVDTYA